MLADRVQTDVPVLLKGGYSKRDQDAENPTFIVESLTPLAELRTERGSGGGDRSANPDDVAHAGRDARRARGGRDARDGTRHLAAARGAVERRQWFAGAAQVRAR